MSRNEISAVDLSKIKNYSEKKIVDLDLSFQDKCLREFLSTFTIEKKKVAIINMPLKDPETIRPELVKEKAYSLYPPLGPLYISSAIEENTDWETDLFDIQKEILQRAGTDQKYDFESIISSFEDDYDAYLFSCMFSTSQDVYKTVSKIFRKRGKPLIFGGVYSTGFYETLLNDGTADLIVKHEGEKQIVNFLKFWEGEDSVLRNISFKREGDLVHYPMLFEKIDPPNIVPQLQYMKDEIENYNTYGALGVSSAAVSKDRVSATIIGNRGCRAACTFCSVNNFMGPKVRTTNEDTTIATIKFLYEECGVRHIDWLDDDLVAYPERAKVLFNRIADLNLDIVFTIQNAMLAIDMDDELVDAIGRAGFAQVGFGVESGSQEIRKKIRRTTRIDNLRSVISRFREKFPHVFIHCNFMLGFPGEKVREIKQTVDLALSLKLDWCNLAVVQALPNTPMWDEFVEINDPRIHTPNKYSPASATKEKGTSIDDIGFEIVDIYSLPDDKVLNFKEVNDIWYPINTRINFLNNFNLENTNNIWKLTNYLSILNQIFPLDPTIHVALSRCHAIEGGTTNDQLAEKYLNDANSEITDKKYWKALFNHLKDFDTHKIIPNIVN
jgi:radical SAM superfamily enzyme YgiQ (UPF0313 family)